MFSIREAGTLASTIGSIQVAEEVFSFFEVGESRTIVVPDDYQHESYLSDFRKKFASRHGFYMAPDVNPRKYPQASQHLVPGMKLRVSVLGIDAIKPVRISNCIRFLIGKGAVLTNAQGLALAYDKADELFARGFAYYGLDVREMLPEDEVSDNIGKVLRKGHRHPMITVPNGTTPMPTTLSHALTERLGKYARFLKFTIV